MALPVRGHEGSAGRRVECGCPVQCGAHRSWGVRGPPADGSAAGARVLHTRTRPRASGALSRPLSNAWAELWAEPSRWDTWGGRAALPSPSGATLCEAVAGRLSLGEGDGASHQETAGWGAPWL